MKQFKKVVYVLLMVALVGCATNTLVSGWGPSPKLSSNVHGNQITIGVSTYGANLIAVKNLVEIAASIVADEKLNCPYLSLSEAKWPNNLIAGIIEVNTAVIFQCVMTRPHASDSVINVQERLKSSYEFVSLIRSRGLLKHSSEYAGTSDNMNKTQPTQATSRLSAYDATTVKSVQKALKRKGYKIRIIDGKWGDGSRQALRNYQKDNGLNETGEFNEQTLNLLGIDQNTSTERGEKVSKRRPVSENVEDVFSKHDANTAETSKSTEQTLPKKAGVAKRVIRKTDLLSAPDAFADVLLEIFQNKKVIFYTEIDDWSEIEVDGKRGYVDSSSLQ